MLLVCAGMPRSASTWQYRIVSQLVEDHLEGTAGGWAPTWGEWARTHPSYAAQADAIDQPPVVLKTHGADPELVARHHKAFLTHRDPRDVVVSVSRMFAVDLEESIRRLDKYLRCFDVWAEQSTTLVSSYGNITCAPQEEIGAIASHLGLRLAPEHFSEYAAAMSIEEAKKASQPSTLRRALRRLVLGRTYDGKTLLHADHVRDGRTGYWAEVLSEEQINRVVEECGAWMKKYGYIDAANSRSAGTEEGRE